MLIVWNCMLGVVWRLTIIDIYIKKQRNHLKDAEERLPKSQFKKEEIEKETNNYLRISIPIREKQYRDSK